MPTLQVSELPSLVSKPESYPGVLELLVGQFSNLDRVDWVLINTFDKLEDEVCNMVFYLFHKKNFFLSYWHNWWNSSTERWTHIVAFVG